jgi:hypothetical protein
MPRTCLGPSKTGYVFGAGPLLCLPVVPPVRPGAATRALVPLSLKNPANSIPILHPAGKTSVLCRAGPLSTVLPGSATPAFLQLLRLQGPLGFDRREESGWAAPRRTGPAGPQRVCITRSRPAGIAGRRPAHEKPAQGPKTPWCRESRLRGIAGVRSGPIVSRPGRGFSLFPAKKSGDGG